jgi:transposase
MEAVMPRPYSADLRRCALRACARGDGTRERIARRFAISESTLYGWLKQEREEDRRRAKPHAGGRSRVIDAAAETVLRELVAADNDATLAEYAAAFTARTGHPVSGPMVCKALKRLGLRRKKRPYGPASGTARTWPRSVPPTARTPPRPTPAA